MVQLIENKGKSQNAIDFIQYTAIARVKSQKKNEINQKRVDLCEFFVYDGLHYLVFDLRAP